jgi:hypothetical protein
MTGATVIRAGFRPGYYVMSHHGKTPCEARVAGPWTGSRPFAAATAYCEDFIARYPWADCYVAIEPDPRGGEGP